MEYLTKYMQCALNTKVLDLTENEITTLGCEYLGKTLSAFPIPIMELVLDFNPIGNEGMRELSKGLEMNSKLNRENRNHKKVEFELLQARVRER